jgi:hypothetical protein
VRDDAVQPLVRDVSRIHVVEEARHVSFARDELAARWAAAGPATRAAASLTVAGVAALLVGALVDPQVYAAVGIDPREGARAARTSPHRRALVRSATGRLVRDFHDLGVISAASRPLWRRAGLL